MYTTFKKSFSKCLFFLFIIGINSCNEIKIAFEKSFIPPKPVNFEDVNSEYDDYNSDAPVIHHINQEFALYFSSNRFTKGISFDIVSSLCHLNLGLNTGGVGLSSDLHYQYYDEWEKDTSRLKFDNDSIYNEYGPFFYNDSTLIFACDSLGSLDFVYFETWSNNYNYIQNLNTEHNEAYLTRETKNNQLYFCSDSLGGYDIYSCNNVIEEKNLSPQKKLVGILNSPSEDKCPYINDNIMVFTSNRSGGYGGFDLYYAIFDGISWSAPINFGNDINTEYDEYRPIVITTDPAHFLNQLMIFSSDRPGGKGGFDLYFVGVEF